MTTSFTLEQRILQWHHNRNLIDGSTDHIQFEKLLEEVEELRKNIEHSQPVIDDIGDIIVVLVNIAHRNGYTLYECMEHAFKEIRHRRGKMVDGLFVKERVDESNKL